VPPPKVEQTLPPAPPVVVPPSSYFRPEIVKLRDEARALLKHQSELYWRNWTTGEPVDFGTTYEGHEQLFSSESLAWVRTAREPASGDEAHALEIFETYLAGEIVARTTEGVTDELAAAEAKATLQTDGTPAYTKLDALLAGEAS